MAHHADTQIQQHSVGPIFPFIAFRQEHGGRPMWGFEGAGFYSFPYNSYDDAYHDAADLKTSGLTIQQARRNEAEFWAEREEQYLLDAMNGL